MTIEVSSSAFKASATFLKRDAGEGEDGSIG